MAGRPRKPTALKLLSGSALHDPGRLNQAEPQLEASQIKPPTWLPAEAKKEWRRIMPILAETMKVLTIADQAALVNYCLSYAKVVIYTRKIEEQGMLLEIYDEDGRLKSCDPHPLLVRLEKEQVILRSCCQVLGLSPADRSRVAALEGGKEANPMEALLGMGGA